MIVWIPINAMDSHMDSRNDGKARSVDYRSKGLCVSLMCTAARTMVQTSSGQGRDVLTGGSRFMDRSSASCLRYVLITPLIPSDAARGFEFSTMSPKKEAASHSKNKKQKLDIPTLTDEERRVVLVQYEKENEPDDAESLITEYLKFMAI